MPARSDTREPHDVDHPKEHPMTDTLPRGERLRVELHITPLPANGDPK